MPTVTGEADLLKQVLDYLEVHRFFHWRCNTGAMRRDKRFIRFGVKGIPDILCCYKGRFVGIECKGKYGEQSQAQVDFQSGLESAGGKYILARKLEDVIEGMR